MKLLKIILVVAALGLSTVSHGQSARLSEECDYRNLSEGSRASDLLRCFALMADTLQILEFEVYRLRDERLRRFSDSVPAGAVVAFDRLSGCPTGWRAFNEGAGRFLIGAGRGNLGKDGQFLTERSVLESGGSEKVQLSHDETPATSHTHKVSPNAPDKNPHYIFYDNGGGPHHGNKDMSRQASNTGPYFITNETGDVAQDLEAQDVKSHNNMPPYIALYFCKKEAG